MKTALVSMLGLSAKAYESDPTNPSRSGQDIKYVFQISAQGSHTPSKSFGLAANLEDEPK